MLLLAPRLQQLPLSLTVSGSLLVARPRRGADGVRCPRAGSCSRFAARRRRQRPDRRVSERGRAAGGGPSRGRPVLQWLHASYALGGVTGAGLAGALSILGYDYRVALGAVGSGAGVVRRVDAPHGHARGRPRGRGEPLLDLRAVPLAGAVDPGLDRAVRVPGRGLDGHVVGATTCAWKIGAGAGVAALVFMAFSTAVFLGRMFAGRVLFGLGRRRTVLVAGFGSAVGGIIATLTSSSLVVGLAFLLLGFTLSAAAPAAFGLVEASDEDPSTAIAAVTTVGYTGFIWSPPLLGWVADTFSLRATMSVIVIATVGIIGAGLATPRDR